MDDHDPPADDSPPGATPDGTPSGVDRRTLQRARRKAARRRRRRWPKRLLISLVVLVVLVGILAGSTVFYAHYRYDQIKKIHAKHLVAQAPAGQPFNLLLVGSDSRAFVKTTPTKEQEFETATTPTTGVGGQRADVEMVARFVPATRQVWILSIPRDLWVTVPGNGPDAGPNRINAAFNTGPDLLIQTIETDLKIPINHYVAVTFTGFQNMVNALGGVTMDFPDPVKDAYSGLDVAQTGCQLVDGATALELVRSRHLYYETTGEWNYDGLSDFSRIQRQDAFFRAVLTKLDREKFDPLTINSFLGAAVKDLTIDTTLTESDLVSMADTFHGISQSAFHTETLPTYGFTTTAGADVLGLAVPQAAQTIAAFNQLGTGSSSATTTTGGTSTTGSTTTTTAASVPPSQISVEVLNGVDFTQPVASDAGADLAQAGFTVSGEDNATTEGLTTTEIQYPPDDQAAAETLAGYLSGATTLVADPQLTGNDLVLTIGSSYAGVTAGSSPSTGAATPPTVGTTAAESPTGGSTTTTTTPPTQVYTNTQTEPWNPTPCVQ